MRESKVMQTGQAGNATFLETRAWRAAIQAHTTPDPDDPSPPNNEPIPDEVPQPDPSPVQDPIPHQVPIKA